MMGLYEFLYILAGAARYSLATGRSLEGSMLYGHIRFVWSDRFFVDEDYIRESFMLGKL